MNGTVTIQPFGFDRVFIHPNDTAETGFSGASDVAAVLPPEEAPPPLELHEQIEELEARIERMEAEHRAELVRARADGFEAGATQARSERGEALLAATDALHGALDSMESRFDAVARTMIAEAGSVALHAAEMLAGHAIAQEPARAVDEALSRAVEQVARGTFLVVRTNPSMREEIAVLVEAREEKAGRPLGIIVVEDTAIPEGDARIEWTSGGLNIDAEARRKAVLAELAGVLPSPTREESGSARG